MQRFLRVFGLIVLGGVILTGSVAAQSPTLDALVEELARLKKQLAQEKQRGEALAAEARAQAEVSAEQAVRALEAERRAREEARRAELAVREAFEKIKQSQVKSADEIDSLRKALEASKEQTARLQTDLKAAQADALRQSRRAEAELLAREEHARKALDVTLENKVVVERMRALEQRLAEVAKQLAKEPQAPPNPNLPAEKVEGEVKRMASGLMELSIGSDAGLKVDHTLELYRLEPKAQYLGRVRIVSVTAKTAAAQPVGKLTAEAKAGDKVTSTFNP